MKYFRPQNSLYIYVCILIAGFWFHSFGFGKNKVQYQNLSWQYYKLPHFHSYFHQDQGDLPPITAQWIENAYKELEKDFGFKHKKSLPLLVFGSPTLFEQTNVTPGIIPEGVGGFTESLKNRIVVPFTGSYEEFRHVLHHECVHAFQYGILSDQFGGSLFRPNAMQMPMWFAEGSAEFLSSGWDTEADMFMMDITIFGTLPNPNNMSGYLVYKGGQSFLFFLSETRGDSTFHRFLTTFRRTKQVITALEKVYKKDLEELGSEWQRELKRIYWPEIGKRENLDIKGTALTSHVESRSYVNLKPRISPDGTMVAYYSDNKDYTKIFIADTKGKVIKRIGQYGYGGYFESFQPFRSGMCWSPESKRIAFVTKNKGRNELRIIDIDKKEHVITIVPSLASITSPDWSPDGKHIVFSGLKQHTSDIYMVNVKTRRVTRLTKDIRYESTPRFSRDGSSIVFSATDTCGIADRNRFHERPASDLFLLDLKTREITQLTATPWNERHPCFSPDGNSIAFVSDRNGIRNIYIAPVDNIDSLRGLTDIIGGCSNPDWAKDQNTLVFSLFQKQGWDIWKVENPDKNLHDSLPSPTLWVKSRADTSVKYFLPVELEPDSVDTSDITEIIESDSTKAINEVISQKKRTADEEVGIIEEIDTSITTDSTEKQTELTIPDSDTASVSSADSSEITPDLTAIPTDTLPPDSSTAEESTEEAVSVSDTGMSDSAEAVSQYDTGSASVILPEKLIAYPYKLKFSIDLVSVGMAYSTIYGYAGQGVIVFSDLLGNHQIAVAGNIQGSFEENNLFAFYINTQFRLDFGLGGFYDRYYTFATLDYYHLYHDTNIGAMLLLRYPFSLYSRIDFNLFYQHMEREPYIYEDGKLQKYDSLATISKNITLPSLSYVFDNILWGITGPINGIRAKATLLASPPFTSEDASFISLDFDIRHYWHIRRKFVWANRLACGFSEPINRDESARRYFLGGNENWIFYRINRTTYEKNLNNSIYSSIVVPFRGWNYFDISGCRYAVFNTEFRFPFVKTIDLVWPLPVTIRYINGAFFFDVGNAWDPEDQYDIVPLPRKIYGGMGFGLRANFGIFVLRYDLAWKTDWHRYMKNPQNYWSLGAEF